MIKNKDYLLVIKGLVIGIVLFSFLYGPFWIRNQELFGNILGPVEESALFNEKIPTDYHSIKGLLSNFIKNITLDITLPVNVYNNFLYSTTEKIHSILGIQLNDQRISISDFTTNFSLQEDMSPNPLHMYLFNMLLGVFSINKKKHIDWKLLKLVLIGLAGIVLRSLFLKFQL